MTVISLCDLTGNMVRPWAEAGYTCVCYDFQHSIRADRVEAVGAGSITYRWADVRSLTYADIRSEWDVDIMFAFPPCTNLAVSGARDFRRKGLRGLIDALEAVEACRVLCETTFAPWMIENPVSRLSSCWRKPDFMFDPCDYGDPYTKKTCLWTGGGFAMPPKDRVEPTMEGHIWKMPPSPERANLRSATPMGFARAVFQANGKPALSTEAA